MSGGLRAEGRCGDGRGTIASEDDEGLRRAVYHYQDRVRAGDLAPCVRRPWVRNRIARCFFGRLLGWRARACAEKAL